MELKLTVSGKNEIERILSLLELGILVALNEEIIILEEVEGYFFNPYTVARLEDMEISNEVIEVIRQGCELEDVKSLLPHEYQNTIKRLREETIGNLKKIPIPSLPTPKLINR